MSRPKKNRKSVEKNAQRKAERQRRKRKTAPRVERSPEQELNDLGIQVFTLHHDPTAITETSQLVSQAKGVLTLLELEFNGLLEQPPVDLELGHSWLKRLPMVWWYALLLGGNCPITLDEFLELANPDTHRGLCLRTQPDFDGDEMLLRVEDHRGRMLGDWEVEQFFALGRMDGVGGIATAMDELGMDSFEAIDHLVATGALIPAGDAGFIFNGGDEL
jgi:hypothetical protein